MKAIKINDPDNRIINETAIIERILKGEKELYEILLRRNNQKLYRVIRSYVKDTSEVEDIMQNTYLKAYEKLHQFKRASSYSTWLIRIGINEALASIKEKGKMYNLSEKPNDKGRYRILEMPDHHQLNPEGRIIRREAKQLLENAIDCLDPKYRTVYMLKEVEKMSTREVSDCLNISTSNVKVRLHRAKSMLKEKLIELTMGTEVFDFGSGQCDRITEKVMKLIK